MSRSGRSLGFVLALLASVGLAGCTAPTGPAEPPPVAADTGCRITRVVDGDTVHLTCPATGPVKARLLGFDTPEIHTPRCRAEAVAGHEATAVLRQVLQSGPITQARFQGQDRYGRALVRLEVGGQDVARRMIASGLALPYAGGRHPYWCGIL